MKILRSLWPVLGLCTSGVGLVWLNIAGPTISHPQSFLLSVPSAGMALPARDAMSSGWRDVIVQNGVAEVTVSQSSRDASQSFEQYLVITTFGAPTESTPVQIVSTDDIPALSHEAVTSSARAWTVFSDRPSVVSIQSESVDSGTSSLRRLRAAGSSSEAVTHSIAASREVTYPGRNQGVWDLHATDTATCEVVWSNAVCRVWRMSDEPFDARSQTWAEALGQFCAATILPEIRAYWGEWPDVDRDNVVNLLISERVGRMGPDVRAYVKPQDFRATGDTPWTQPWDVIYIRPAQSLEELRPVLQHELTHVAEFSWCRELCGTDRWPLPDWLTEGLAHATEIALAGGQSTSNLDDRLRAFAEQTEQAPLVVTDAAARGLWRNPAQRGASATFCYWWLQTAGRQTWPEIIHSYQAAQIDPWQELYDQNFSETYRQWTLDMLRSGLPGQSPSHVTRVETLTLHAGEDLTRPIRGTATLYVKLDHSPQPVPAKRVRVAISPSAAAILQVTQVCLPRRSATETMLTGRSTATEIE